MAAAVAETIITESASVTQYDDAIVIYLRGFDIARANFPNRQLKYCFILPDGTVGDGQTLDPTQPWGKSAVRPIAKSPCGNRDGNRRVGVGSQRSKGIEARSKFLVAALLTSLGARSTPSSRLATSNFASGDSRNYFWQPVYPPPERRRPLRYRHHGPWRDEHVLQAVVLRVRVVSYSTRASQALGIFFLAGCRLRENSGSLYFP